MNKNMLASVCLLVFLLSGCSSASNGTSQNASPSTSKSALTTLNRGQLKNYTATFEVQFNGAKPWKYQLTTRRAAGLREENLHIEGVEKSQNPGDVRMVTDGETTWMIGAGTDLECVRFPNNQGMDPSLVYPETLIPQVDMPSLSFIGEETAAGRKSQHYSGSVSTAGSWKDLKLEIYQEKSSGALLQFAMQAAGEDPFFGTGAGSLTAQYSVKALDVTTIEPVKGCEITTPLPGSAKNLVRLPGMVSFESAEAVDQISQYFQSQLPAANWQEMEPPVQSEGSVVLSYLRDAEEVEVHIEGAASGGTKVKLLFLPVQQ